VPDVSEGQPTASPNVRQNHYCFAPTPFVAAKFVCPSLCKVETSVAVVRWECVKSPHLVISKDCAKSRTVSSFHALHQGVISTASDFRSRFRYPVFWLLVFTFGTYFRSCWALMSASAWPSRLFSTMAVWLIRLSLSKTRREAPVPSSALPVFRPRSHRDPHTGP